MTSNQDNSQAVTEFVFIMLDWSKDCLRPLPWRKKSTSNYKRIVSEILLQRTKADVVSAAYHKFFRRFPSWNKISTATENEIADQIKPLGLWRQRSVALKELSGQMVSRHGRFPTSREEIDKLPGVGQYVANAIELFVHEKPAALLDVNMARVLERYFGPRKLADIRYDPYLQSLAKRVVEQSPNYVLINWSILDFAALVCKKNKPECNTCPLGKSCKYKLSVK